MPKPWGIYARVSTKRQADDGLSVEAQLDQLHTFANTRGYVVREFVDRGKSAWRDDLNKRPAFKTMLDATRAGELAGIIVTHLDRFSRNLIITLSTLGELGKLDAGFISLENSAFDFSRPADRLLMAVMGAFAQYYSDELSRKIKRGLRKRASKGLYLGAIPFGYCNGKCPGCAETCDSFGKHDKDTPPKLDQHDAPGVLLAFETYHKKVHSDSTIANILNEAGYRSRTRQGRVLWNKHSIAWMLTNQFYTGKIVIKGEAHPGQHTPIISQELFDAVQLIRRRHWQSGRTYSPKHRVYLFAGITICAGCGRKLRASTFGAPSRRGYRCTTKESAKGVCPCSQGIIPAEVYENQFGEIIKQFCLPSDWRERMREMLERKDKQPNSENERARLTEKLERLKWLFVEGELKRAEYEHNKRELDARLVEITAPQDNLQTVMNAGALIENFEKVWDSATLGEQREIVLTMVEQVICDSTQRRMTAIKPKPGFMPLFRQSERLIEHDGTFQVKFDTDKR